MLSWTDQNLVIAKIVSQGATRETDLDDEFSIWFRVEFKGRPFYFQIPPAPCGEGYSMGHLETIEQELLKVGLDLLPLDHNLLQ